MNERLKQLMIEVGYAAPELADRAQRLSELILFECVKIAVFKGHTDLAQAIREHFGVEL